MRKLLGVATALVAVVVTGGAASAQEQGAAPAAQVRVAHLSPDTEGLDVFVDGQITLRNVGFDTVSDYLPVPPGNHTLQLRASGAPPEDSILTVETELEGGASYTVAGLGERDDLAGEVFTDDLAAPPPGQAKVRAIHAAVGVPAVDVVLRDGPTLFTDAEFMVATPYTAVAPGVYDIEVRAAGTDEVLLESRAVELGAGIVYTVAAIGGGPEPLRIVPVVDARGAAVPTVGGVATGAGGTAVEVRSETFPLHVMPAGAVLLAGGLVLLLVASSRRRQSA